MNFSEAQKPVHKGLFLSLCLATILAGMEPAARQKVVGFLSNEINDQLYPVFNPFPDLKSNVDDNVRELPDRNDKIVNTLESKHNKLMHTINSNEIKDIRSIQINMGD